MTAPLPADHQAALAEALKACSRGWRIVPLHRPGPDGACSCGKPGCPSPGKHPRTQHGLKEASADQNQVELWGAKWSGLGGCNYGVLTGQGSGIVVLDIDPRHEGFESLKALQFEHGELPTTPTAHTGGGGMHFYFQAGDASPRSRTAICPGIDFKGEGGYVVSPGSLHASGASYFWSAGLSPDQVPLAALPAWLADLIASPAGKGLGNGTRQQGDAIPEGRRNSTLTSLAGTMRSRGMTGPAIVAALLAENTSRCTPPLDASEVEKIAGSVARYAPGGTIGGPGATEGASPSANVAPAAAEEVHSSDLGNSRRFADQHNNHVRYCPVWKVWLIWDGRRWVRDRVLEVVRLGVATIREIYAEAKACEDETGRTKLARHALASESNQRINAMLELAKSDSRIAVAPDAFDGPATKYLFNCLNGTLDLETGQLRAHDPADMITALAPVSFDPEAGSKLFDEFLEKILPDPEVRSYIRRFVGYTLSGDTSEQVFGLLHGTGANGKSTLLETLLALFGDYGHKADFETFLESKGSRDRKGAARVDLLELKGKRLVVAMESGEGRSLDSATIKELTGGDTITARGLFHAEQTSFKPAAKVILAANHLPEIKDGTESIWRRVHQVPFSVTIPLDARDPDLPDKLSTVEVLSTILNWALAGFQEWRGETKLPRLQPPPLVLHASREYREEQDCLAPFLAARCRLEPGVWTSGKAMREAQKLWFTENGQQPLGDKALGRALGEHGVKRAKGRDKGGTRGWVGIGLVDIFDSEVSDTSDTWIGNDTNFSNSSS